MLSIGKHFSRQHFDIFIYFQKKGFNFSCKLCPKNYKGHFLRKIRNITNLSTAESALRIPKVTEKLANDNLLWEDMNHVNALQNHWYVSSIGCRQPILLMYMTDYHIFPKYWDRLACANSVYPDQMPQNAASDHSLQCLPLIQQFSDISTGMVNVLNFQTLYSILFWPKLCFYTIVS